MNNKLVVFFTDGVLTDSNVLIVSCGFTAAPGAATSRIMLLFDDGWAAHDVPEDNIVSLTYSKKTGKVYALGQNGIVKTVGDNSLPFTFENTRGKWQESWIEGVDTKGNMTKIKEIAGSIYACGWGNQIYKLINDKWVSIYNGNDNNERMAFLDIDGIDSNNIYAVGIGGLVLHYDGINWTKIELNTNCNFHFIISTFEQKIIIGGAFGSLFYGLNDNWKFIGNKVFNNIWAASEFQSNIYLATSKGLKKYNDLGICDVELNLKKEPTIHHFATSNRELWSIGEFDLALFKGVDWSIINCPENE